MQRIITITSGKGGVGKTNISVNLALQLSRLGHKVCLFDADLGLANVNIILGLQPEYDLKDVIEEGRDLKEIMIKDWEGIDILPGSSGVEEIANLELDQTEHLIESFSEMDGYDFLLFDTSAGISRNVVSFCLASSEVIMVLTPEPTSLTDGYSLLKVLSLNGFQGQAKALINQCKNLDSAKVAYTKLKSAAAKYLGMEVSALGMIYHDVKVVEAVKQQKPVLSLFPDSPASVCIKKMADRIVSEAREDFQAPELRTFWKKCFDFFRTPLKLQIKMEEEASGKDLSAQQAEWRRAAGEKNPEGNLLTTMEKLIESISAVSRELQLVRKALEGNGKALTGPGTPTQPNGQKASRKEIRLDFEAYVNRRRGERKES